LTKEVMDRVDHLDARGLGMELVGMTQGNHQHIVYVKTPDGARVTGFFLEEETLADSSKVYNVVLIADQS
jgi:hypothetical protein